MSTFTKTAAPILGEDMGLWGHKYDGDLCVWYTGVNIQNDVENTNSELSTSYGSLQEGDTVWLIVSDYMCTQHRHMNP